MVPTIIGVDANKEVKKKLKISQRTQIRMLEDKVKRLEAFMHKIKKEEWRQHISEDNRS
jgi:hypothetical protein